MSYTGRIALLVTQVVVWLAVANVVVSQPAPPKPLTGTEFVALLQSRLGQVGDLTDLDDATKNKIRDLYKQAIGEMEAMKPWSEKTTLKQKLTLDAPKELAQIKLALAVPVQPRTEFPPDTSLTQIEKAISDREAELEKLRKALTDDENELKNGATRRATATEELTKLKDTLNKSSEQLQLPPPTDEKPAIGAARRMLLLALRRVAEQKIAFYEEDLKAYEARIDLLPLRRDLDAKQITLATQEVKLWQDWANKRRQAEADQQAQRAAWEADKIADPVVQRLAQDNADLASQRKTLAERIVATTQQRDQVSQELETLKEQFKRVQAKVQAAGKANVTHAIGLALRQQRDKLPNLRDYPRDIELQQQLIDEVQIELDKLQEDRFALSDLDSRTQLQLQQSRSASQHGDPAELTRAVHEALENKRDYLVALINDHNAYFDKLLDLITTEQQLVAETEKCALYIDERVFWIASAGPFTAADVKNATDAAWWLAGPKAWINIGQTLSADAVRHPVSSILALGTFLTLIYWRFRFRGRLQRIGEKAERGGCCLFLPTLEATVLTALIAVGWPGLMWYFGWRLNTANGASELCKALGEGLLSMSRVYLALELLRYTCCHRGLAQSHFGWPDSALRLLRSNVRIFIVPLLLLMCVAVTMAWQENNDWDSSLGRMAFTVALLFFAFALHRVIRPASVVFQAMIASRRNGLMERFRYIWYPLIAGTPLALAIMAAVGYHYTSRQLVIRLILSIYVLVGGIVCRALLLRWTLVNQRKLAIEQARQRRAAAQAENVQGEEASGLADIPVATPERDLATINAQTRRLIEYALAVACSLAIWCAWVDVMPAMGKLNKEIGYKYVTVTHEEVQASGAKKLDSIEELREVRLSDLFPRNNHSLNDGHCRQEHSRPLGNGRVAAFAVRRRRPIRRRHGLPLCDYACRGCCSGLASWASGGPSSNGLSPP